MDAVAHSGVIVIGKDNASLATLFELLSEPSEGNLRLVEDIVRCVLKEQEQRS